MLSTPHQTDEYQLKPSIGKPHMSRDSNDTLLTQYGSDGSNLFKFLGNTKMLSTSHYADESKLRPYIGKHHMSHDSHDTLLAQYRLDGSN